MADEGSIENPAKRIKLNDKDSADETGDNSAAQVDGKAEPCDKTEKEGGKNTNENGQNPEPDDGDDADNEDDNASDISSISGLSELSGEETWAAKPAGSISWVYRCMSDGMDPKELLSKLMPGGESLAEEFDEITMWKLIVSIVSEPPPRKKLEQYNILEDALGLLTRCSKIMVLTGAGVSVSCGIPDFRSKNGIYARLAVDFPDLPDPQAMFDIRYFKQEQRPFFKFAKEIFPGQYEPSNCHKFIKLLEDQGKLLRNYTQNIDTLEQVAGIKNVVQCHGSFATATCMACKYRCTSDEIKEDIMNQVVPRCKKCDPQTPLSVLKPDIVFFGESLPEHFHDQMRQDKEECDLLIVIGSSLKVRPVALVPTSLPANVPQILINKERLRNQNFDIELLGDCDLVVGELCRRLGERWSALARKEPMTQIDRSNIATPLVSPHSSPAREETVPPVAAGLEPDQPLQGNEEKGVTSCSSLSQPEGDSVVSESFQSNDGNIAKESKCSMDKTEESSKPHTCAVKNYLLKSELESGNTGNKCNDQLTVDTENSSAAGKDKLTEKSESSNTETADTASCNSCNKLDNETTLAHTVDTADEKCNLGTESVSEKSKETNCGSDNQVPGTSHDCLDGHKKKKTPVYSCNMADLLKSDQFCYIPPNRYIFPMAEYNLSYRVWHADSEDDIDDEDEDDLDDAMSESSDYIDLTSGDETDSPSKKLTKDGLDGHNVESSIVIDSDGD